MVASGIVANYNTYNFSPNMAYQPYGGKMPPYAPSLNLYNYGEQAFVAPISYASALPVSGGQVPYISSPGGPVVYAPVPDKQFVYGPTGGQYSYSATVQTAAANQPVQQVQTQMKAPLTQDVFQPSAPSVKNAVTNKAKLSLFFINDMHGHFDNMTNILGASRQFDKDTQGKGVDTIKLSAGDNFAGGDAKKNALMLRFMDFIGIDASAVGNHEYDASATNFYNIKSANKTKFLAANAKTPAGSQFYNNIQKSTIIEKNGNQYGIVGLMPVDLETVASKKEALEGIRPYTLEESVQLAQAEVDRLRAQGINKIILTSHLGIDKDKQIASMLEGVDIIQGGHSHNLTPELKEGENVVRSKSGEPVIIVQAGENGKYAGILDVDFDENGVITAASLDINKAELEKSPVLEYIKSSVLGNSPQVGEIVAIDPTPENRRIVPCAWTNLLADSMRAELNTDIAFVNAANMRKVPKCGRLSERDITETTPLTNTLMISRMTEKEIVRVVREAAKTSLAAPTGEPGIMHVSGLTYKATSDGDLLEMNFVDKNGNKTPIDINNPSDDKFYTVAHDSFVAEERDNPEYPGMLIKEHKDKQVQHFNFDKDKTAAAYIRKLPNKDELSIIDDHRIEIVEKDGSMRTLALM